MGGITPNRFGGEESLARNECRHGTSLVNICERCCYLVARRDEPPHLVGSGLVIPLSEFDNRGLDWLIVRGS